MGKYYWEEFIEFHGAVLIKEWLELYGVEGLLKRYSHWLIDKKVLDECYDS